MVTNAVVGGTLHWCGEFPRAQEHLEHALAFHDPPRQRDLAYHLGQEPGLMALQFAAVTLWCRGYPDQALARVRQLLELAKTLEHPFSLAAALNSAAYVHLFCRDGQSARVLVEELLRLAQEHGFAMWVGAAKCQQGWALIEQASQTGAREQGEAGLVQIREGLAALQATGTALALPLYLSVLAQGAMYSSQEEEGLRAVTEALALVEKSDERWCEAELYRLKGELLLTQEGYRPQAKGLREKTEEVEACFLRAIEIAQKQHAKSLELRAVMSLVRLRQQQARERGARSIEQGAESKELGVSSKEQEARSRLAEAHRMLSDVYNWFTEGFDTKDLQEAKALLAELSH